MRKTTHHRSPHLTVYETRKHLACIAGPEVEGSGYGLSLRHGAPARLGKRLGVTAQAVRQAWNEGATVAQVEDWRRRIDREDPPAWALTPREVDATIARHLAAHARQERRQGKVHRLDYDPAEYRERVTGEDLEDAFGPPLC